MAPNCLGSIEPLPSPGMTTGRGSVRESHPADIDAVGPRSGSVRRASCMDTACADGEGEEGEDRKSQGDAGYPALPPAARRDGDLARAPASSRGPSCRLSRLQRRRRSSQNIARPRRTRYTPERTDRPFLRATGSRAQVSDLVLQPCPSASVTSSETPFASRDPLQGRRDPLGHHDTRCGNWRFKSIRAAHLGPVSGDIRARLLTSSPLRCRPEAAWRPQACHRGRTREH